MGTVQKLIQRTTKNEKQCIKALMQATWDLLVVQRLGLYPLLLAPLFAFLAPLGFHEFGFVEIFAIMATTITSILVYAYLVGPVLLLKWVSVGLSMTQGLALNSFIASLVASAFLMLFLFSEANRAYYGEWRLFGQTIAVVFFITFSLTYAVCRIMEDKLKAAFELIGLCVDLGFAPTRQIEPLQAKLPAQIRGQVLQLKAEGKYVHVITEKGKQLLPMSLSRAIENLQPEQGLRIHRSHWVSWSQMERIVYENGNPRLVTVSTEVLPVSRNRLKQVKSHLNRGLSEPQ